MIIAIPHAATQNLPPEGTPSSPNLASPDENTISPPDDVPLGNNNIQTKAQKHLDMLFEKLRKTRSENAAKHIANNIWSQWMLSGSAGIDLMMHWANEAVKRNDFHIAMDFLDQIIIKKPDYAEGWNKRATLHFNMSNYSKSMADIQKVLTLEPRHFGAWSGMATILERTGKKKSALKAWQQTLKIYPAMKSGQSALLRLYDELEGDPA